MENCVSVYEGVSQARAGPVFPALVLSCTPDLLRLLVAFRMPILNGRLCMRSWGPGLHHTQGLETVGKQWN